MKQNRDAGSLNKCPWGGKGENCFGGLGDQKRKVSRTMHRFLSDNPLSSVSAPNFNPQFLSFIAFRSTIVIIKVEGF